MNHGVLPRAIQPCHNLAKRCKSTMT